MHFTSFANVFQNCTGEQPKIHAWRLFNCLNFHHLFKKLSAMLKSVPKSLIFFHKKKKKKLRFSAKIYKSNFSAKIQCVIFRNRNFFPCKKSTVAISARKFKYLISNFPQKSTVAVLANFDAQIQMREIPNFGQFWRENSNELFF